MAEEMVPRSKISKETANYRAMEQCEMCIHFKPPNKCKEVEGNVSPNAVCDEFALKEHSRPWNKDFYAREYGKHVKKTKREPYVKVKVKEV